MRVLAGLLLLAGCGGPPPALPRLAPGDVVLAFGDSLTHGTGAAADESYPSVLARLIGREVVRAGVPGEVSEAALARLPAALDEHRPRLLILCVGGNDLLRKLPEARIESNLRAMLALARGRGVAVVLVGVPRPALLGDPPPFYRRLAQEFGVPYEADMLKDVLYAPSKKSDPIHPNAAGYREIAEALARLLRAAGAV